VDDGGICQSTECARTRPSFVEELQVGSVEVEARHTPRRADECVRHPENCYLLAIRGAILSFELFFCVLFVCYLCAICMLFACYLRAINGLSRRYSRAIMSLLIARKEHENNATVINKNSRLINKAVNFTWYALIHCKIHIIHCKLCPPRLINLKPRPSQSAVNPSASEASELHPFHYLMG